MNESVRLAEQHVREWDSHLRHLDEMWEKARSAPSRPPEIDAQLMQIRQDRDEIAKALDALRHEPFDAWPKGARPPGGLGTTLETVGDELQRVVTALFVRP
jgi:hypothetical protein